MVEFEPAVEFVLLHEGGYVFNHDDPGGETNFGISKRTHPNVDIANLTREEAKEIYRKEFWIQLPFAALTDQATCNKLFDMCVNLGFHRAVTIAQEAAHFLGVPLQADGVMGVNTVLALNGLSEGSAGELLAEIKKRLTGFYGRLVAQRPSSEVFLKGWLNRANA